MKDVLEAVLSLLKTNLTGYKTIEIGDPAVSPFTYPRPSILISPMLKDVKEGNLAEDLNQQDYAIQLYVMSEDYPTSQDRDGILRGCELAKEVDDLLELPDNRKLGGVVDGKHLAHSIEDGYFMALNKNVFSATPRITATYYKYEERDLQPSGL